MMYQAVQLQLYHMVHSEINMPHKAGPDREQLVDRCLAAFVQAGTLDLSLDRLAARAGISKRMLVHYFGGRENLEERAMTLLEEKLRARFAPESFPRRLSSKAFVEALWEQTTAPEARRLLVLLMDLSKRAWSGSARAKAFYDEQRRLWVQLLLKFLPDQAAVEEVLQMFQGAVLAYLVTGDREPGRRALMRLISAKRTTRSRHQAS
jgi:AcrR family transcriptional regulator